MSKLDFQQQIKEKENLSITNTKQGGNVTVVNHTIYQDINSDGYQDRIQLQLTYLEDKGETWANVSKIEYGSASGQYAENRNPSYILNSFVHQKGKQTTCHVDIAGEQAYISGPVEEIRVRAKIDSSGDHYYTFGTGTQVGITLVPEIIINGHVLGLRAYSTCAHDSKCLPCTTAGEPIDLEETAKKARKAWDALRGKD